MRYSPVSVIAGSVLFGLPLRAQSLERRIIDVAREASPRSVQFSFAARSGVCGDGSLYLSDGLGGDERLYDGGNFNGWRRGDDETACEPGPVRVVATVGGDRIIRLRTFVGPERPGTAGDKRDLGRVAVTEAVALFTHLAEEESGRASADAILPIVLADSIDPWPKLLRLARNDRLPRNVRSTTDFWLARGAGYVLGVNGRDRSDDDDVRAQAVFALSQQPRESAVPQLIEVVRHSSRPAVRAQALFWLGQSGDSRALDLFADILRRR